MKVLYDPGFGRAALGATDIDCGLNHCTCDGTNDACPMETCGVRSCPADVSCPPNNCQQMTCGGQCPALGCAADIGVGPVLL